MIRVFRLQTMRSIPSKFVGTRSSIVVVGLFVVVGVGVRVSGFLVCGGVGVLRNRDLNVAVGEHLVSLRDIVEERRRKWQRVDAALEVRHSNRTPDLNSGDLLESQRAVEELANERC